MSSMTDVRLRCVLALLLTVAVLAGCQTIRVEPFAGRYRVGLTADDTVAIMRRAGLSDEDILEYGTELRNSLALRGAARIQKGDRLVALFVARKDDVIVATEDGTTFVYEPAASDEAPPAEH